MRWRKKSTPHSVLVLGGARSGKSSYAETLARGVSAPTTVIATAEPFDDDMRSRISAHRRSRPDEWATIEEPLFLRDALARVPVGNTVIVDCITVWLGNMVHRGRSEQDVLTEIDHFIEKMSSRSGCTIVVSNEVGLGIVPESELGREYRDLLGRVNTRLSSVMDRSLFMVAGKFVELRDAGKIW